MLRLVSRIPRHGDSLIKDVAKKLPSKFDERPAQRKSLTCLTMLNVKYTLLNEIHALLHD